ncbi:hypothetical protein PIB30_109377, partial [Stylosanthes scabra]|nr:hypothetical protein [Stylosanthes scabra]
ISSVLERVSAIVRRFFPSPLHIDPATLPPWKSTSIAPRSLLLPLLFCLGPLDLRPSSVASAGSGSNNFASDSLVHKTGVPSSDLGEGYNLLPLSSSTSSN